MASAELTLQDDKLLRLAANGKSANEIAEEVGLPAENVVLRIRDILRSRDIWSDLEREKLLMHSIYDIKERLESNITLIAMDSKLLKEYRGVLELLGQRLEARTRITDADLEKVSIAHGRKLVHIVELGYYKARSVLADEYPDVDLKMVDSALKQGLEEAALEFEEVQNGATD